MFSNSVKTVSVITSLALLSLLFEGCSSDDNSDDNENKDGKEEGQKDGSVSDASDAESTSAGDEPCADGPSREGEPGDSLIRLRPTNDAEQDFDNLQWAVDSVAEGGTLELCDGTFLLGDGDDRKVVHITQGIHIVGKKGDDEWLTIIEGGGGSIAGSIGSGPIRIANDQDNNPNVFEKLWLRGWTGEAIDIDASKGFTLKNCRISNPLLGPPAVAGMNMVHAIFSRTPNCNGDFAVTDSLIELGNYTGDLPVDEQLLGILGSAHDNIRLINNTITGLDEAIEILINNAPNPSEIVIKGNTINISFELGDAWYGKNALLIGGNKNTTQVLIEDNVMNVRGPGNAMGVSGENFTIKNNKVELKDLNGALPLVALQVGLGRGEIQIRGIGPSLNNSVVEDNELTGSVQGPTINFSHVDDFPNESHGNVFRLGDDFVNLGAETTIYISTGAYDNTFEGDTGTVQDDSPEGANSY